MCFVRLCTGLTGFYQFIHSRHSTRSRNFGQRFFAVFFGGTFLWLTVYFAPNYIYSTGWRKKRPEHLHDALCSIIDMNHEKSTYLMSKHL